MTAVFHGYEAGELADARAAGVDLVALDSILDCIRQEFLRASALHPKMHSLHEAEGVIREEFEEFWDEVKIDDAAAARVELLQLAAMAVRALHDVPADFRKPKPGARPLSKAEKVAIRAFLKSLRANVDPNASDEDEETAEREMYKALQFV
jgi:glutamyl-tRNA reductase